MPEILGRKHLSIPLSSRFVNKFSYAAFHEKYRRTPPVAESCLSSYTMAAQGKRKSPPDGADVEAGPAKRRFKEAEETRSSESPPNAVAEPSSVNQPQDASAQKTKDRMARFKALQARNSQSRTQNRKETAAESQRLSTDPNAINSLNRRQDIAAHKLMKADAEDAGEDFERKRAWDWTIEESEKWDRRMEKKERNRANVAFQDYRQDAQKVYKRELKQLGKPDLEAYEKEKREAIERAAENGSLEIVETGDGELVAVDKDGAFYSTANSTDFTQNKPDKAAVDRLVNELKKADEVRMKKRRDRGKGEGCHVHQ